MASKPAALRAFIIGILFFLPLVVWSGFLFPSAFAKAVFFTTAVETLFVMWLAGSPAYIKRSKSALAGFVGLFFITNIVAAFLGQDISQSFWSNYERTAGLFVLGHIVIFFFIVATSIRNERDIAKLSGAFVFGAIATSLLALPEIFASWASMRVGSTFRNSAFLASYLVPSFFVALWLFMRDERVSFRSILWVAVLLLIASAIFFTGTRGAFLALSVGVIICAFLFIALAPASGRALSISFTALKKIVIGCLLALLFVGAGAYMARDKLARSSIDAVSRLADVSFSEHTMQGRFEIWRVAWRGWREQFWFGWGPENLQLLFNKYYDPKLVEQEPWIDRAHNFIFDVGGSTGIVGLFAYLGLFASAFFSLARGFKRGALSIWIYTIFSGALVAHLMQNLFIFDALASLVALFTIFAFVHALSLSKDEAKDRADVSNVSFNTVWTLVGAAIVVPLLYVGVWKPAAENYFGKFGYDAFARGDDKIAKQYIERALSYDTYGNIDVRRAVAEYVFDFLKKGGKRDAHALKQIIDYAAEKMEENIREKPLDVKWYMYQGQLYNLAAVMLGSPDREYAAKAERRYLEALKMSPGRPQIYLEIAQAREVLGDYAGMWSVLDEAVRIAPDYLTIHYNILAHAINIGDRSREESALKYIFSKQSSPDYGTMRDAYYKVKRYSDAADSQLKYIDMVKMEHGDNIPRERLVRMYQQLAGLYKLSGEKANARKYAEKVRELDPSLTQQVDAFLQSL